MKTAMVDQSGHVFYTCNSLFYMGISHVLDTLLHPGIAYLMYQSHRASGGALEEIITWNNIIATFVVSRLWSIIHTYHNTGEIGAWYFGYDVYHVHDLDLWMPAYLAEGTFLIGLIGYKLSSVGTSRQGRRQKSI